MPAGSDRPTLWLQTSRELLPDTDFLGSISMLKLQWKQTIEWQDDHRRLYLLLLVYLHYSTIAVTQFIRLRYDSLCMRQNNSQSAYGLTIWRLLLPYGYSYKASHARPG